MDLGLKEQSQCNREHTYRPLKHMWREGVWFCESPPLKKESSKLWLQPKLDQWCSSISGSSFKGAGVCMGVRRLSAELSINTQRRSKWAGPFSKTPWLWHDFPFSLCKSAACFLWRHSPHLRASMSTDSRHPLPSRCGCLQVGQSVNPVCSTKQHLSCIFMPSDACY